MRDPRAVSRACVSPVASGHVTIADGRAGWASPSPARKRAARPVAWAYNSVMSASANIRARGPRRRRPATRVRRRSDGHRREAGPRCRSTTPTDRRPSTTPPARDAGSQRRTESRSGSPRRAGQHSHLYAWQTVASNSVASTGSQPAAWVRSQSARAPARVAAAAIPAAVRHLARRRLHERERHERGVARHGVGEVSEWRCAQAHTAPGVRERCDER